MCASQQVPHERAAQTLQSLFHVTRFLPAGLFWEPVKGNSSVSTRTFEKSLDGIMPVVVVVVLHTRLQGLEIGVVTLSGRRKSCERSIRM